MKSLTRGLWLFGVVGVFTTTTVIAQVTNLFNFYESGKGNLLTNGIFAAGLKSTTAPDPSA